MTTTAMVTTELSSSTCPHGTIMSDCSDAWCVGRLGDDTAPLGPEPADLAKRLEPIVDIAPIDVMSTPGLRAGEAVDRFMAEREVKHAEAARIQAERDVARLDPFAGRDPETGNAPDRVPVGDLLRTMGRTFSDFNVKHSLDAIQEACFTDEDRKVVRRYAALRRAASGYNPRHSDEGRRHSTHKKSMIDAALGIAGDGLTACGVCGARFKARRGTTTCPDRVCRAAAARRRRSQGR